MVSSELHDGPPPSSCGWREGFWRRLSATSDPARKYRYMGLAVGLVAVVGVVDFLTGFELSLLVFYFVPVCLAVAAVGWRFGTLTAVLSVATWLAGDIAAGERFANPFVPVWNALIALSTYLIVVWLLASAIALQREMEERVRQRTAALTAQNTERVRLEKVVLETTERERRAIGHDLHDGLGQHLTGTALVAEALAARMSARSPEDALEVKKVVGLIERGIEQTRNLAKGLLLAEVEREGLVAALQDLATTLRADFRTECVLDCEEPVRLDESGTATHLLRIAQEAARNAVRHGRAKRISIALRADADASVLEIRDNGTGLPPPSVRGPGLGLRIMAHRAAIIGASLEIEPQGGGGTRVTCRLAHGSPMDHA